MRKHKLAWGAPQDPTDTRWGKKVIALFLSLTMCLSTLPTMALAAENNSTDVPAGQTEQEQVVPESDSPDEEQAPDGEQSSEEPTAPETDTAVAAVQQLINELPDADGITAENAEEVSAQLDAIDEAKAGLTDEQSDKLELTRYNAAVNAMLALSGAEGANGPVVIAETNAHEHTDHTGWTALTTDTYGTAIQSKIYNPKAKQDEGESPYPAGTYRFYLDEDIEPENSSSYIVSAKAGQHIIICMNGHTLKGYTFNGLALFRAEPGGTVTFCDCVGTGAIVAKVNPNEPTQTGGVAEVVDSNTWLVEERLEGGIVNLYGGTLKSENPKGSVITAEYHQDYSNDYNAGHINIYGGAVEAQRGQAAIAAARHATLTIAGGSKITGDVYASDMTIGTKNGDKVIINGVLKGADEATTIQSLVNTNITKLEANADYKNPIESCTIGEISGAANVTIKDSTILTGTLNMYNSDLPENRDVTIINSNLHDTVVGGRNITIENTTVGSIKASEFYIWQTETVERSTVSLSGVTVNGDVTIDPAGWRDSESSLTLKDTTVTGTVRTAGSADTITVDGAVNCSIALKDGQ